MTDQNRMNRVFNSVFVRGELYDTHTRTEEGNPVYGELWNVIAENDYGERLVHNFTDFRDLKKYDGPCHENSEGNPDFTPPYIHDPEGIKRAERFAKRAQASLDKGGTIDRDYWHEIDPAYGSQAYSDFGTEDSLIAWERDQHQQGAKI